MIKRKFVRPSIDVIPIDIENTTHFMSNLSSMSEANKIMPNMKYFTPPHDPQLINRVKEYLAQHSEERQVDIVEMADYLQSKYREYARRKRRAFQAYVKNAYEMLLDEYKRQHVITSWSDDEDDDDDDDDDVIENENVPSMPNHLNDGLMKIYQHNKIADSETINITISSDEDEETTGTSNESKKKENNESQKVGKEPGEVPISHIRNERNFKLNVPRDLAENRKRKLPQYTTSVVPSKRKRDISVIEPKVTFKNVGGIESILEEICKLLVHIKYPEIYRQIGVSPPRGFLLNGPPGCGKTLLAHAIAGELSIPLLKVAAPELVAGVSGESEERIRNLFDQALEIAPCILFIDEIDAITPNRQQAQREMERRIVAQLLSSLDDLSQQDNGNRVLVVGATNRPDAIDPALRRAGRFDREVTMGIPNVKARASILRVLCKDLKLGSDFDFDTLATFTPGFVGADLMSLVREAAMAAVDRVINDLKQQNAAATTSADNIATSANQIQNGDVTVENDNENENDKSESGASVSNVTSDVQQQSSSSSSAAAPPPSLHTVPGIVADVNCEPTAKFTAEEDKLISWLHDPKKLSEEQLSNIHITGLDFQNALKCVQPSLKREGFATVPDVTWDDVGSLNEIRDELKLAILAPVRHAEQFESLGITTPTGVLLCGPPGCGKTLLAKAIANEAGINFISVKGPELLNMYLGESERAVRVCFQRARNSAPCVIFFDELDALCPKRSDSGENAASMRVVNQMLTEMDGIEGRKGVYLMAASNRPEIVDPAVLRPGRFDKIIYVGLPTANDRVDILRAITKNGTKPKLSPDVDLSIIGRSVQCSGYTGADLAALVREAAVLALREYIMTDDKNGRPNIIVTTVHFEEAIRKIRPSITEEDQKHYDKLKKIYSVAQTTDDDIVDVPMDDS